MDSIERAIGALRQAIDAINSRIDATNARVERLTRWLIGIQLASLIALSAQRREAVS